MASDRLKQLQQFYKEDPDDPFNLYVLALEYLKYDQQKSKTCFESLLDAHPDYLPACYHAGKLFMDLGEKEKAITVFLKGISLAKKLNDKKTLRELQSAYDEVMFD
jgi:tetratricopeptide (TPR) repeat protein